MYDYGKAHHILKTSSGKVYNIFYRDGFGILSSVLGRRNTWLTPAVVTKDCYPGFSACIDKDDRLHIVLQDKNGNLKHALYENEAWNLFSLLNSKNPSAYEKHPQAAAAGRNLLFFYVLKHAGRNLLSYQTEKYGEAPSPPKAIDYIEVDGIPFRVTVDRNEVYVFYRKSDGSKNPMGIRKFNLQEESWNEFKPVGWEAGDTEFLTAEAGTDGTVHAIGRRKQADGYRMVHVLKKRGKESWEEEKTVALSPEPFTGCGHIAAGTSLLVFWLKEGAVWYSISENGGVFSKAEKYAAGDSKNIFCFRYQSNAAEEPAGLRFSELPGTYTDGYRLGFHDLPLVKQASSRDSKDPSPRESAANPEAVEVKAVLEDLSLKIRGLEARIRQLEVDMDKYEIRSELSGSELTRLKTEMEHLRKLEEHRLEMEDAGHTSPSPAWEENKPVMPGAGFSQITPDYLKSMKKT